MRVAERRAAAEAEALRDVRARHVRHVLAVRDGGDALEVVRPHERVLLSAPDDAQEFACARGVHELVHGVLVRLRHPLDEFLSLLRDLVARHRMVGLRAELQPVEQILREKEGPGRTERTETLGRENATHGAQRGLRERTSSRRKSMSEAPSWLLLKYRRRPSTMVLEGA